MVLALVLCLLLGPALAGCARGTELDPPSAGDRAGERADSPAPAAGQARSLVSGLQSALRERDPEALAALATEGARPLLVAVARNVEALDVVGITLRYLAPDAALADAERADLGADAFAGRVALEFAYDGVDQRPARVEARVLFAETGEGLRVAGFGGVSTATPEQEGAGAEVASGTRTPLWLAAPLEVVRDGRTTLAVAVGEGDEAQDATGRYPGLVRRGYAQVREVLPQWQGPLVVEVPADADQLDAALAAPDGRYDAIAGVATSVDGSTELGGPTRVYLNPAVFGALSGQGAQVVLTHEATHVAVGAPFADMPLWLLEGFADYVALAGDRVPVDVAARQVLQRVRTEGLPDALPTAEDLQPTAAGRGATYEEAWLACRYLGQEFGQAALVRFYDSVDAGTPTARAFADVLGTTQQQFVAGWRRDVAGLAGVAG